ncbi:MAG: hypothetical protein HQ548_07430 [Chloroflexi bacterium]|nr:hypothetical protein [Chloroflexota bacterium]
MNTRPGSHRRLAALLLCLVPLLTWACAAPAAAPAAGIESTATPIPAATRTAGPASTAAPTSAPTATSTPKATPTEWPLVPPGAHVAGAEDAPVTMVVFFNFT